MEHVILKSYITGSDIKLSLYDIEEFYTPAGMDNAIKLILRNKDPLLVCGDVDRFALFNSCWSCDLDLNDPLFSDFKLT